MSAATVRPQCGAERGYRLHWLSNEIACGPCLAAHAAESRRFRQQHGAVPRVFRARSTA